MRTCRPAASRGRHGSAAAPAVARPAAAFQAIEGATVTGGGTRQRRRGGRMQRANRQTPRETIRCQGRRMAYSGGRRTWHPWRWRRQHRRPALSTDGRSEGRWPGGPMSSNRSASRNQAARCTGTHPRRQGLTPEIKGQTKRVVGASRPVGAAVAGAPRSCQAVATVTVVFWGNSAATVPLNYPR